MPARMLILDHCAERRRMLAVIAQRALTAHRIDTVDRYSSFIEAYFAHAGEIELISLGHGILIEPTDDNVGNGRLAALTLARMRPTAAVILHSRDFPAVRDMQRALVAGKWPVWTIAPADGWNWLERDWAFRLAWLAGRKWISDWDKPNEIGRIG